MILAWLLAVHGIVCILGAFFPFYPPVFLFYWFAGGPFAVKLIIVLVAGVSQVVAAVYLVLKKKGRGLAWYWLAIMVIVPVALLLVFPATEGLFS